MIRTNNGNLFLRLYNRNNVEFLGDIDVKSIVTFSLFSNGKRTSTKCFYVGDTRNYIQSERNQNY